MSVRLYQWGWQLSCQLLTDRNVKDLSFDKFTSYCFSKKMSVRLYQWGWQFTFNLLTGRNVKDLSPEKLSVYCLVRK